MFSQGPFLPGLVTKYIPPLFLYRITIGMTAARNVQHSHYDSERINTEVFQLIVPEASITQARLSLGGSRQLSDLVQQRLVLSSRVLGDLVPEVVNLLTRSSRWVALFEFPWSATMFTHTQSLSSGGERKKHEHT